jgi:hypothetical protein
MNLVDKSISKPRVIMGLLLGMFWVMAVHPFICEFVSFEFSAHALAFFNLLTDGALLCMGLWTIRKPSDWSALIVLLLLSYITTCMVNGNSLVFWINGLRYYMPLVFYLPIYRYMVENDDRRRWFISNIDKSLFTFLVIQFPCMVYQFSLHGAGDYVGGSLGNLNSGIVSTLIYLISFYLMLKRWNYSKGYFKNLLNNWLLIFLLVPSFLNETKISFIYFALYFFFLIPMDRKFIKNLVAIIPLMIAGICGCVYMYIKATDSEEILSWDYLNTYVFGNEDILDLYEIAMDNDMEDELGDSARGAKLMGVPMIMDDKPWGQFIGYGVGQYKGGTTLKKSDFYMRYEFLLYGTQMQGMTWYIELGLVGLICAILLMFHMFRWHKRVGADRNLQLTCMVTIIFILNLLYQVMFISIPMSIVLIYLIFISSRWSLIKDNVYEGPNSK